MKVRRPATHVVYSLVGVLGLAGVVPARVLGQDRHTHPVSAPELAGAHRLINGYALAITGSGAASAAARITPPVVPSIIAAPTGSRPFMVGRAVGTQNFICAPAATESGFDWLFIGPQATLFNADLQQIATHYQSKNPVQADAIQATWQSSRDTSGVWATKMFGTSDPEYVAADAIEWLLLRVTGVQVGPAGGDKLASARFIQRVNTVGGVKPPSSDCTAPTVNSRKLVYYEADYYFYEVRRAEAQE